MTQSLTAQIANLTQGQTLLVRARKVKNPDKVQFEFAEKVTATEGNPNALLSMLNQSDSRFTSGARRCYETYQIADVARLLNINCGDDAAWVLEPESGHEYLELGVLNPKIGEYRMRIQIRETIVADDYQAVNIDTTAKRKGKEGEFIMHKGQHIFSNTNMVPLKEGVDPTHTLLIADATAVAKPAVFSGGIANELGM
jgi:hypothetical protein